MKIMTVSLVHVNVVVAIVIIVPLLDRDVEVTFINGTIIGRQVGDDKLF